MAHLVSHIRPRLRILLLGCLLAALLGALFSPAAPTVRAQDNPPGEEAKPAEKAEAPAAASKGPNILTHMLVSVGWVFGFVLLFVSICLVALIVLLAMELRMGASIPPGFVDDFTETVNKRRFKEAYEMAREDGSFLGRVLTTGMSRLQYGIEDAREAAFNMVDSVRAGKEQLVTYLATIGTLGPMLGLVGTVYGMIKTFLVLSSGGTPNPARLAEGISHALVVTLFGVGLSVPAIFCHAFFRNRLIRISLDTSNVADDLLTQMYHNSKKPASAAVPPPTPDATAARAVPAAAIKPQ
jgi:biopolymer transport protein ExbB